MSTTDGMTSSPATKAAWNEKASALIHHTEAPNSKGVRPTIKLFTTTRGPQIPRVNPTVLMASQNQPQHALSISPPMRAPMPKSRTANPIFLAIEIPVQA